MDIDKLMEWLWSPVDPSWKDFLPEVPEYRLDPSVKIPRGSGKSTMILKRREADVTKPD